MACPKCLTYPWILHSTTRVVKNNMVAKLSQFPHIHQVIIEFRNMKHFRNGNVGRRDRAYIRSKHCWSIGSVYNKWWMCRMYFREQGWGGCLMIVIGRIHKPRERCTKQNRKNKGGWCIPRPDQDLIEEVLQVNYGENDSGSRRLRHISNGFRNLRVYELAIASVGVTFLLYL